MITRMTEQEIIAWKLKEKRHKNNEASTCYHKNYPERINARNKIWRKNNPDKVKKYDKKKDLKSKYGMTLEDYNQIFEKQFGCCAICGRHQSSLKISLCVDHDHITGKIRGLLCTRCNWYLGYIFEDSSVISKMEDYFKEYGLKKILYVC